MTIAQIGRRRQRLRLVYSKDALKTLSRLPVNLADPIRAKLRLYVADPSALANNVRSLQGHDGVLRMRMGGWRVLFTDSGEVISVIRIAPRGAAYDDV